MLISIHRYLFFAIGLVILVFVVSLIKKRRLSAEFSVLWILTSLFLMLQILPNNLIGFVCGRFHLQPVALVSAIFLLFITAILLYYSILISTITRHHKEIVQKLGMLEVSFSEKQQGDTGQ